MVARKKCGLLILLFIILLFSGCASKVEPRVEIQYVDRVVEVEVPTPVYPKIKKINKPSLPIKKISKTSTAAEVAEAYYNSLKIQIEYSKRLENVLSHLYEE